MKRPVKSSQVRHVDVRDADMTQQVTQIALNARPAAAKPIVLAGGLTDADTCALKSLPKRAVIMAGRSVECGHALHDGDAHF